MKIDKDLKKRIPLIGDEHIPNLIRIAEHKNSPKWNYACGDRIQNEDIDFLKEYDEELKTNRNLIRYPDQYILDYVEFMRERSWFYGAKLKFYNIKDNFFSIPVTTRSDFANSLSLIIPYEEDLSRLVLNPTSGTTGHRILCPNHPKAIGCYNPLILYSLKKHGVIPELNPSRTLAMQLYNQKETAVYCTVKPILNGIGFAKINLNPNAWRNPEDSEEFIFDLKPDFFSGNPIGFKAYLDRGYSYKPKAFLSTSMQLSPSLRTDLEKKYEAQVVDFYSLNDTGPLGYSCPKNPEYFHVLPWDIFLEITDQEGNPKPEGEIGYITVTGGRNPYLPLIRYQTGDFGSINYSPCECGETTPRFQLSDMRKPVFFFSEKGESINPIDAGRILREYPIFRHRLTQKKNMDLILEIQVMPSFQAMDFFHLEKRLRQLFGMGINLHIEETLFGDEKIIPYINENETI